jgi:hypothetical protein
VGEAHLRAILAEYQAQLQCGQAAPGIAQHVPDDDRDAPRATAIDLDTGKDPPHVRSQRPDQ